MFKSIIPAPCAASTIKHIFFLLHKSAINFIGKICPVTLLAQVQITAFVFGVISSSIFFTVFKSFFSTLAIE